MSWSLHLFWHSVQHGNVTAINDNSIQHLPADLFSDEPGMKEGLARVLQVHRCLVHVRVYIKTS